MNPIIITHIVRAIGVLFSALCLVHVGYMHGKGQVMPWPAVAAIIIHIAALLAHAIQGRPKKVGWGNWERDSST